MCETSVIDTICKLSPLFTRGDYTKQYQKFGELKKLADTNNIMIAIVHHLSKSKSDDPFEMLYGSNAISGAADVIWILQRERGENYANLIISGRDVPEQRLPLELSQTFLSWVVMDPSSVELLREELQKIYYILLDKGVAMGLEEISIASGFKKGRLSKFLKILIKSGFVEKMSYGMYRAKYGRKEEKADSGSSLRLIRPVASNFHSSDGYTNSKASGTTPCDENETSDFSSMLLAA